MHRIELMYKMNLPRTLGTVILAVTTTLQFLSAAEYFVGKTGNDAQDGTSREKAFLTIQKGVDALKGGDTLTIAPGEYQEAVKRSDLGSSTADTRIRAELPGTVLLRGDVAAPDFKKIEGYKFIYVGKFPQEPEAVLETDTLKILNRQITLAAVEFEPGTFYYDKQEQMLYISSSDLQPPDRHHYTVSVIPNSGLHLEKPVRVTLDGLAATGYYSGKQGVGFDYISGIFLKASTDCTIRRCIAYLNATGICLLGGKNSTVDECVAYGNYSKYQVDGGNIIRFKGNNDVIKNCVAYASESANYRFYDEMEGPVLFKNNLAWGSNGGLDYLIKGTNQEKFGAAENNIGVGGWWGVNNVSNSLIGGKNTYSYRGESQDNISPFPENPDQEFADPKNFDYRLQATSSLRKAAPNGGDRGPFRYRENIFYVKPGGDDGNDGLSVGKAWKTLARAVKNLNPGDTLYLEGGVYEALGIKGGKKIFLRGRGDDPVVIKGAMLAANNDVVFERLNFVDAVKIQGGRNIQFKNCGFTAAGKGIEAEGIEGMTVSHCNFSGFSQAAVGLANCSKVILDGNLYANVQGAAIEANTADSILYSDYNSYQNAAKSWQINGSPVAFEALQKSQDKNSAVLTPEFKLENGVAILKNAQLFAGKGPLGTAMGIYGRFRPGGLRMVAPYVHSVGSTTANVEWFTSRPVTSELAWGDTPACSNIKKFEGDKFGSFSLTGLEPGKKYYFQIRSIAAPDVVDPKYDVISFTTEKNAPAPRTWYVATDGSDKNDGLSREKAWKTLNHAAAKVGAGDTVLVAQGSYHEMVWMRATGDGQSVITWKSIPGEKVICDGLDRTLSRIFVVGGKSNITFDGFYFVSINMGFIEGQQNPAGAFYLYASDRIQLRRCFMQGRGVGYSPGFVYAYDCANLLIRNCVITGGFQGMMLYRCPDLYLENNVFLRNSIAATVIVNREGEQVYLNNNVITDSIDIKKTIQLFEIPLNSTFNQKNNCFYLRLPEDQRTNVFWFYQSAGKMKLPEYFAMAGSNGSMSGDPQFQVSSNMKWEQPGQPFFPDMIVAKEDLDFPDLFVTREDLIKNKIGLLPEDFADFHFNKKENSTREQSAKAQ